jgi:hypothetical protein
MIEVQGNIKAEASTLAPYAKARRIGAAKAIDPSRNSPRMRFRTVCVTSSIARLLTMKA